MVSIYRYFAVASALATVIVMVLVGFLYYRQAIDDLTEVAEGHNVALAHVLSSQAQLTLSSLLKRRPDNLAEPAAATELDNLSRFFRSIAQDISVLKIKIYQLDGRVVYSSVSSEISENRLIHTHPEVFKAVAQTGRAQSKLSFKDRITAFSGETFERDVVETYVPIKNHGTKIVGVFELYSDVTHLVAKIDRTILGLLVGLPIIFALFYGVLVLVIMRRAITPLRAASTQAETIGPQSAGMRLSMEGVTTEMQPLIVAINGALERLDEALEVQRRFISDAAHELLTPLAILKAHVDTMNNRELSDTLDPDIDTLSNIVTQQHELAELDGAEHEKDKPVDIHDICMAEVTRLAPLAIKAGKSIALTGTEAPVTVLCQERALSHAIRNIVENAITHTAAGTTVTVDLQSDGTISVCDEGPGIPEDKRSLIFERFWRGSHHTGPGAGLGLSIVKRFVDMSGGEISVEDAPGGGAKFVLRLPAIIRS